MWILLFDYLAVLARYISVSGDTEFANQSWASIAAAYQYCLSSIGSDHLPHIPPDKEAGDEQHRPADDLALSASWMTAAAGYAELARLTGHSSEAETALQQVALTRQSIADHYWNPAMHFWFDGHTPSGEPINREAIGPAESIGSLGFSPEQQTALLDRLASADFQADWGTREVAASAKDYNPYSYGAGSVSPVSSMAVATGFWQSHRPESAYAIWNALMQWTTFDSMGHVHEVLAGNFYQEQTESVAEQTWSSAALLDGTIRGLFGLTIDAAQDHIMLAPHLPFAWPDASLANVRAGKSTLAFTMQQSMSSVDLDIENQGPATTVFFNPQVPLGARLTRAEFQGKKIDASIKDSGSDAHASVTLSVPTGRSHLHVAFGGGVAISVATLPLRVGDPSTAPKILKIRLGGKLLQIDSDVCAGHDAILHIRTPWKLVAQPGAELRALPDNTYEVRITNSSSATPYSYAPKRAVLAVKEE